MWWREPEILLVAYSGMRWGEHVALRAKRVDVALRAKRVDAARRRISIDRQVIEPLRAQACPAYQRFYDATE